MGTLQGTLITGQRNWSHHPRNTDPCLVLPYLDMFSEQDGERIMSCAGYMGFQKRILLSCLENVFLLF